MTKLLNKPLKTFAGYALIILVISIPVYVFLIDYIWVSELDENNWLTLQHTKQKLQSKSLTNSEIEQINHVWGELQPGVSMIKVDDNHIIKDSVYEVIRPNKYEQAMEKDRFRGLISYVTINGEPYQLTIETNIEESDETFIAVATVTLFFFILLILGFIILNRRIAKKTWKPFYQILDSLKSFELSKDHKIDLPNSEIQEFQALNESIQHLVGKNVTAYQLQKSFTENASHELQTPIALLKAKVDLLIQEKEVTPEISEIIGGINAPLTRLSRINKNLLLLAKVENHQYTDQKELKINEVINSSLILFEDYISDKKLKISINIQNKITINANAFLLETLIHNVLSNAIRHTDVGGEIKIQIENMTLLISNTGLNQLDDKHLFRRFANTSKDKVSSGLGLAIVMEICNKCNWKIDYQFKNGFHAFSVEF